MKLAFVFSLLFLFNSAFSQTDAPGNITIQPGGVIRFTPHADATNPLEVTFTKSWRPEGKQYQLYLYKHIVILKRNDNGSFEFTRYYEAFLAAGYDQCNPFGERNYKEEECAKRWRQPLNQ